MALPKRRIGKLEVGAIGLGCMNLSFGYGSPPPEDEGIRLLNRALDLGVTLFDTAAVYGEGGNERLLGKAIMHRRSEFRLASKCVLGVFNGRRGLDGSPAAITQTLDEALQRLGTDFIDLYYLHRLDRNVPVEESIGALARAVEAGKIGAVGVSEMSAETIRRGHAVHPITAVQSEYSPWVRNPEVAVLDTCRELDIGLVAFSPVGRGMLTGSVEGADFTEQDLRKTMPRFQEPNLSRNMQLLERFCTVAAEAGVTPAQLSLAWVLSRGGDVVPIPGTRSIAHLEENVATLANLPRPDALEAVDEIFHPGAVAGRRYSSAMQAFIDTELLPEELEAAA